MVQIETPRPREEVIQRLSEITAHFSDKGGIIGHDAGMVEITALDDGKFSINLNQGGDVPIAWMVEVVDNLFARGAKITASPRREVLWMIILGLWMAYLFVPMIWSGSGRITQRFPGMLVVVLMSGWGLFKSEQQRMREETRLRELLGAWLA